MKRTSRRSLTAILAAILLLTLFGCGENGFEKPETNLEFWICDNADDIDLSNCKERYGIMGGRDRNHYGKCGFKIVETGAGWNPRNPYGILFKKGKTNFNFMDNCIRITADVSNKSGIMF